MAVLQVNFSADCSRSALSLTGDISFGNGSFTTVTASFAASRFDDVQIRRQVIFDGLAGIHEVHILGSVQDMRFVLFNQWSATDKIFLDGTAAEDRVTGSIAADLLSGFDGNALRWRQTARDTWIDIHVEHAGFFLVSTIKLTGLFTLPAADFVL